MKVVFLGVGEAFDENYPNNSSLIITEKTSLMVDCGDSAVRQLWKYNKGDHNLVDALYISHRHSDHLFGLPAMLGRFHEEKRTKPFTVICTKPLHEDIKVVTKYAYQGLETDFSFKINIIEIEDGKMLEFQDLKLSFALARHSTPVVAIKVDDGKIKFVIRGMECFLFGKGFTRIWIC